MMGERHSPVDAIEGMVGHGRLEQAASHADALLREPGGPATRPLVLAWRGLALALRGLADDAEQCFEQASAPARGGRHDASVLACWAEASLWGGRPHRAIEQAREAARRADGDGERARIALTLAWATRELGRQPTPSPAAAGAWIPAGAAAELGGLRALANGSPADAVVAFESAARHWADRHMVRALICSWAAGDARRRAGHPGAATALRAALDAAGEIGFEPLAARIRRSLRLAGDRPAPRPVPRRDGDVLTPGERQVLDLVERGRTNTEIARCLGLGRPTVARLLSNAMLRLGAQSRAQAVVLAGEARVHGLQPRNHDGEPSAPRRDALTPDADGRAILALLASGRTLGDAAVALALSRRTADRRLALARAALGVERTVEAVARARALGWLGREAAA